MKQAGFFDCSQRLQRLKLWTTHALIDTLKNMAKYIEEHGVSGIEEHYKSTLQQWKAVEINIGVTGDCGVGKSSFINAIRG